MSCDGKIFEGRVRELLRLSEYEMRASSFLTPAEQQTAFEIALHEKESDRCFFWGGAFDAERRLLIAIPEWMIPDYGALGGVFDEKRETVFHSMLAENEVDLTPFLSAVEMTSAGYDELCHRDYLGALLSMGIDRSAVGDIAVLEERRAVAFMKPAACTVALSELKRAGRDTLRVYPYDGVGGKCERETLRIPREYEFIDETVMSERLDGVVKAICKMSRDDALELVKRGDVTLNYKQETKPDRLLVPGDVLSVRGIGKFIYDGNGGVNRRGRVKIHVRKYL